MQEITYTKFPTHSVREVFGLQNKIVRVGVPGAPTFDYSSIWSTLSLKGTCFQAVFKSSLFYIHTIIYVLFLALHLEWSTPNLRGADIPEYVLSGVQTVAVFCVVFFTNRVYARFNERFHDVCKTNGAVTVVSSLTTGMLGASRESQAKAISLCRYTVCIIHVYYFLITGSMDRFKWNILVKKGLLLPDETAKLELNAEEAMRIESNISTVRGLAAKQIAYTITQVPLVYFSFITVCTHTFLLMSSWRAAQNFCVAHMKECTTEGEGRSVCYGGYSVMILIGQLWLLFLFSALYVAAVWMSDPMGTRASNYDLGVDLDGLWNEAQNAINAMMADAEEPVPVPQIEIAKPGHGFKIKTI